MKKGFRAIPDREDIAGMERDLRFHPSLSGNPQALSPEQVESFNRDGFLKNLRVYDDGEIDVIRTYFDELLERTLASGGDSYSISTAHLLYGTVFDILTHPPIVAIAKDVLGPDVIGWGSHFFCKLPGDGKAVAWHQDASYWPMTPSKTATIWLAIDKADLDNACMSFIAGSHRHGHLTWRESAEGENNVLNQTVDDAERYGEVVPIELEAGEVSVHSDLLLHGSKANQSERRRCGLTLRYCTPDVRAENDWHEKGVVVSGRDYSGNWSDRKRPKTD
ncbi:MAG: phytanoyl-CoA dioxygenase family protein [Planctomycetota bacterium]|nr:phytanoyl-CoA dioxygenase family protein [Planctomycetota bacterium]